MVKSRKMKKSKAKVAEPVKKYVKSYLARQIEDKFIDTSQENQGATLNGSISAFAHPDQGLDQFNRIGNYIRPTRVEVRYDVNMRTTATLPLTGRLIIFQWKPQTTPVVSNILSYSGTVNIVNSPYNADLTEQYRILYDKVFDMNTTVTEQLHYIKFLKRDKLMRINLTGTLGSSSGNNKLYYIYCDNTGGGSEGSLWSCVFRLHYEDA